MDRDNKREITISIPESIYEELQGRQSNYPDGNVNSSRERNERYPIHGNRRMW